MALARFVGLLVGPRVGQRKRLQHVDTAQAEVAACGRQFESDVMQKGGHPRGLQDLRRHLDMFVQYDEGPVGRPKAVVHHGPVGVGFDVLLRRSHHRRVRGLEKRERDVAALIPPSAKTEAHSLTESEHAAQEQREAVGERQMALRTHEPAERAHVVTPFAFGQVGDHGEQSSRTEARSGARLQHLPRVHGRIALRKKRAM